ncbi:ABC transporter substrate-binding protein [Variovorax sp. JS1663]|uniref:ABC transporter substrate-binding protein n=1 Tax=Variovorax sp. JS1663 TaxID=1851577 RepID=UPI000B3464A5|nr:ABC transporter substrate-binding protein [Variovorax sp. JS1663]OUL99608.1 ABC transporter permease [Variovorax sp. JS1663]
MNFLRASSTAISALAAVAFVHTASAQAGASDDVVRIGLLTDMASLYSDFSGKGSVEAVRMAIEDFGGQVLGKPIELVSADHQNKPDIAATKAREWLDAGKVDAILGGVSSGTALAISEVGRQKSRIVMITAAYTSRLTNEACAPYTIHYQVDTNALTNTPRALVRQGADSWFFLTADYVFGQTMQADATAAIQAGGGKVLGSVKHPLNSPDFSSYLLQAQASNARFIGLANAGGDTIASIKAARDFGLMRSGKQNLVAMALFLSDIHALGLPVAQGIYTTASFYWDRDDKSRAWSERFFKRTGKMPSEVHAADYSGAMAYLKAIAAAGTDDPKAVRAKLRELPIDDIFASGGRIRDDGRLVKDVYLVQVKTPAESKRSWDYLNVRATIPGSEAFPPIEKGQCALVKKS